MARTPRATALPYALPLKGSASVPELKRSGMTKMSPDVNNGKAQKMTYAGIKDAGLESSSGAIAYTDFDNVQDVFAATVDFDRPDYNMTKSPMTNAGYDGTSHRLSDTNGVPKR